MYWKKPQIAKVYEALTIVADNRIEVVGNSARCIYNDGNLMCELTYDPVIGSIMSNDNTAYYSHAVSAPMIAYLIKINKVVVDNGLIRLMTDIYWDDIYKKFKNDYEKSIKFVFGELKKNGDDIDFIRSEGEVIYRKISDLKIKTLGELRRPGR